MPLTAPPSVSDSIAYLRDFVHHADPASTARAAHSPAVAPALTSAAPRRAASAGIAVLGEHSSSALRRHTPADQSYAGAPARAADTTYSAISGRSSVLSASDSLRGVSGIESGPAAQRQGSLFRYGKDNSNTVVNTTVTAAPSHPSFHTPQQRPHSYGGGIAAAAEAAPPPPLHPSSRAARAPQWERGRTTSFSSPPFGRAHTGAAPPPPPPAAPFSWRRASVDPPSPSGAPRHAASLPSSSSLLWGWGDGHNHSGATAAAAAASPSPFDPRRAAAPWRRAAAAYEEVRAAESAPPSLPAQVAPNAQASRSPRRRPPLAPYPPVVDVPAVGEAQPAAAAAAQQPTLTLAEAEGGDSGEAHAVNLHRIARYLKDYYARESDETARGVESLSAEDVAGLAQCFYVDLYRAVRVARQASGLETSSFAAEDPPAEVVASVAPAPAAMRRERGAAAASADATRNSASPVQRWHSSGEGEADGHVDEVEVQLPASRNATPPPPPSSQPSAFRRQGTASPIHGDAAVGPSHPAVSAWLDHQEAQEGAGTMSAAARAASEPTRRAPNSQLAYSGGGTHPVQVITARLPAFRNDDAAVSDDVHSAPTGPSRSALRAQSQPPRGRAACGAGVAGESDDAATEAMSSLALAATPSPPYVHHTSAPPGNGAAHVQPAAWVRQHAFPPSVQPQRSGAASTTPMQLQGYHALGMQYAAPVVRGGADASPGRAHNQERQPQLQLRRCASEPGAAAGPEDGARRRRLRFVRLSEGGPDSSSDDSDGEYASDYSSITGTAPQTAEGGRGPSRRGPGSRQRGGGSESVVAAEPTSGIVKRLLKDLMPMLRSRGTVLLKHIDSRRRPHLRLFQILDCMDTYQGNDVLMPHLTWATPEGVHRRDRLPRARRTKHGAPLPTGLSFSQQEVPYETALNLVHLRAVYVGAGRGISNAYMSLFHRRGGDGSAAVLDHADHAVADGMCAVFVFASRPVAVTFLREDDRQIWVGAMMGVVERNRTLKP